MASVQLIKKTDGLEPKTCDSVSAYSSDTVTKTTDSWNLKPINVTAITNPLQGQTHGSSGQFNSNTGSKQVKPTENLITEQECKQELESERHATFGLPESPSESSSSSQSPKPAQLNQFASLALTQSQSKSGPSLSMRPSDIDLHELQLSGESKSMSQRPSDIDLSAMRLSSSAKKEKPKKSRARKNEPLKESASQNSIENLPTSVQAQIGGNQDRTQKTTQGQMQFSSTLPSGQPSSQPGNQLAGGNQSNMHSGFMGNTESGSNIHNMGGMISETGSQSQGIETESGAQGGFMRMMSNEDSQDEDSLLAEFSSNIQNNSSFLSELNLTETDQNFMSQHVYDNNQSNSNNMNNQMNNYPNIGIPGFGSGGINYQQPNMNFDMFNSQNTGYNFPNFGGGPYPPTGYLGNQSASQNMPASNSYPSSMYPMPGMMQPGMYGYPYAPYPYPHMMAPMPFYPPMPMPHQYGQGASNIPQMNMPHMSGDNQMNTGNSGPNNNM